MHRTDPDKEKKIYVIGYPKSGNTWFTRMVSGVLNARVVTTKRAHSGDERTTFTDEWKIIKAHTENRNFAVNNISETDKVFYVVRDFRDVLVSGFFFSHRKIRERSAKNGKSLRFFVVRLYFLYYLKKNIISWQGNPIRRRIKRSLRRNNKSAEVGNWSEHVKWGLSLPNCVLVKFEELLLDCFATMKKALDEAGLIYSEEKLHEVVSAESFHTKKRTFEKNNDIDNLQFMRKGVSGDWQKFLPKKYLRIIYARHGAMLEKMLYVDK